MKKFAIIALMLAPTLAFAQTVQQAEKVFDLKITQSEALLIGEGLGMLPFNKVAPLLGKLQQQINAQQVPVIPPTVPGPVTPPK